MMANKPVDIFKYINMHGGDTSVCWEWKSNAKGGGRDHRPYFTLNGRKRLAYRVAYEVYTGKKLGQRELARHKCDNPRCCNPTHIEPGSHQDNMNDMKERERHGLPHHTVRAIRKAAQISTQEAVATLFGVSRETVSAIVNGRIYKHVNDEE